MFVETGSHLAQTPCTTQAGLELPLHAKAAAKLPLHAKLLGGGGGHWLVLNFTVIWLCMCVVVGEQLPRVNSPQGLKAVIRLASQMLLPTQSSYWSFCLFVVENFICLFCFWRPGVIL